MSSLNVRRTGQDEYGHYIKALVCGEPGSGKTIVSSTAPGVLYASAEGGLMSVADRGVPYIEVTKSEDLNRLRLVLSLPPDRREAELGVSVETVVIDTIDEVQKILMKERLEEERKEQLAQADWGWLGDQLRSLVRGFRNLSLNVVFTCHLKTTEDQMTGATFFKPALQGAMGDEIAAYVDLAVLLRSHTKTVIEGGEAKRRLVRTLQTVKEPNYPWIKDRSGKLPAELEVNFSDDFARIIRFIFGNGKIPPPSQELATLPDTDEPEKAKPRQARSSSPKVPAELPLQAEAASEALTTAEPPPVDLPKSAAPSEAEPAEAAQPELQSEKLPEELPEKQPEAPKGQPGVQSEAEPSEAEPQTPEAATAPEDSTAPTCSECGAAISGDQSDLSQLRFRVALCSDHYKARKVSRSKK